MTFSPTGPHHDWITHVSRRAMATDFVVLLAARHAAAVEAVVVTLELLDEIERRLTFFDATSEISRINREAAERPVRVSAETFDVIESAVRWSERTHGRFDITAGPLVRLWGFTERRAKKPSQQEIDATLAIVGWQRLRLDRDALTVAFDTPGMAINLGGIGKGYAIDRLAGRLREQGITDFLIHGGQSSVYAAGSQSPEHDRGWAVGIGHPTRAGRRLVGVWLRDAALGTSGSGKQFFHHRGTRYGHVIDPRSGYPSTDLLALSVRYDNATDADAAGTGFLLAGTAGIDEAAASGELAPMIGVRGTGRQEGVEIQVWGEWDWIDPPPTTPAPTSRSAPSDRSDWTSAEKAQ